MIFARDTPTQCDEPDVGARVIFICTHKDYNNLSWVSGEDREFQPEVYVSTLTLLQRNYYNVSKDTIKPQVSDGAAQKNPFITPSDLLAVLILVGGVRTF